MILTNEVRNTLDRLEGRPMERRTEMVREYTTQHEFHADEQKLSREGWTAKRTAPPDQKPGLVQHIRARFLPTPAPMRLVVT